MAKAMIQIFMDEDFHKEFENAITQLETYMRIKAIDAAVRAAAKPAEAAVKRYVPHGNPQNRKKMSKAAREDWSNYNPLHKIIKTVVRKGKYGAIATVGPSYDLGGGHGNLYGSDHKKRFLWGKDTGSGKAVRQFIKLANDESHPLQRAAFRASMKESLERFRVRG